MFDCILFADCIYTEYGAKALHGAIQSLLISSSGTVIGVLPAFRPGVSNFEASMKQSGFIAKQVAIAPDVPTGALTMTLLGQE